METLSLFFSVVVVNCCSGSFCYGHLCSLSREAFQGVSTVGSLWRQNTGEAYDILLAFALLIGRSRLLPGSRSMFPHQVTRHRDRACPRCFSQFSAESACFCLSQHPKWCFPPPPYICPLLSARVAEPSSPCPDGLNEQGHEDPWSGISAVIGKHECFLLHVGFPELH